jgi:YesN/AraC family two-component response regulator
MNTILLVDDERWVRTSIRKTIERTELPFEVINECSNGLEALDWLKDHTVDLILADIRMPVMDGLQFIERIRELRPSQAAVVVSGHDDFTYVQKALRLKTIDYLLKPVDVDDMRKCLQGYLSVRKESPPLTLTEQMSDIGDASPVEKVVRLIHDKLPKEITLQEAALYVHLNPSYLSQLFKQKMNQTFVDYVVRLRMEEAAKLLTLTSLRISEISERLGYADISYFSSTFKRVKGLTPSEFRKNARTS